MTFKNPSNKEIQKVLENAKTIAVVGLSDNPNRVSYQISKAMQQAGYTILPINPEIEEALGVKAYNSLQDAELEESIDIINVFRRSEFLPGHAEEAAKTNARVFWAQQGVYNETAYEYLKALGFIVVMDNCIKVAHAVTVGR